MPPRRSIPALTRSERWALALLAALMVCCAVGGGSARGDVFPLMLVRPASILILAGALLLARQDNAGSSAPRLLLAALAVILVLQLVPMPPAMWLRLPGHAPFAEAAAISGQEQPWRPLSLTPDLTVNSLLALACPAAALVLGDRMGTTARRNTIWLLIGVAAVSVIVAVIQLAGLAGAAYAYARVQDSVAVGLFANRNHQATLIAMTFPLLRAWTLLAPGTPEQRRLQVLSAISLGLCMAPLLLATGSRAGLIWAVIGLGGAALVAPFDRQGRWPTRVRRLTAPIVVAAVGVVASLAALSGRAVALDRLFETTLGTELRLQLTPVVISIARQFFPLGSGFGSFDPVFRVFEPNDTLRPTFFNHAHNDALELILVGGLPAGLVLAGFLGWFTHASWRMWRQPVADGGGGLVSRVVLARVGSLVVAIGLFASTVDYPLRTPLLAAVVATACTWLVGTGRARREGFTIRPSSAIKSAI